jgi:hypothetical protein
LVVLVSIDASEGAVELLANVRSFEP